MTTPLRTVIAYTLARRSQLFQILVGEIDVDTPIQLTVAHRVAGWCDPRRRRSPVARTAHPCRRATPTTRERSGTIVSPTDPSDTPPGGCRGTVLRLGRRDDPPTSANVAGSKRHEPVTHPGLLVDPRRQPHRPPLARQPLQPVTVSLQHVAPPRAPSGRTRPVSNSPPPTPTVHRRAAAGRAPPAPTLRNVRVSTSRCSPDTRPSSNDTPNAGTAAAVSARCNNRPPSRTDVFAASASDFSGNDDTFANAWANATSRPSSHDFNTRKSAITSLQRTPISTAGIHRRHPPNQGSAPPPSSCLPPLQRGVTQ